MSGVCPSSSWLKVAGGSLSTRSKEIARPVTVSAQGIALATSAVTLLWYLAAHSLNQFRRNRPDHRSRLYPLIISVST